MPRIRILTEADLRAVIGLDRDAVECIEGAFRALAGGKVVMPPILRLDIPEHNGEVDVKTAYVPGFDSFAIKISPGFFDNPKLGLPSVNGLMALFSATTGLAEALLLDNGYLTDIRTAAAGAVAAKWLAREDAATAAIIGAGAQARLQLEALCLVRPIERARIWARRRDAAQAAAAEMAGRLGIDVSAADTVDDAVRDADIVVTTTPATAPVFMAEHLNTGMHVTAMGSDAEHKNEIDPFCINAADVYAADSLSQARRLGELHHAIKSGVVGANGPFTTIGKIIAGTAPGRTDPDQITICDLTGTGVQDTAIATLAVARARSAGTVFET